ncbi:PREDICTED: uncharacterized protein LOC106820809 [Priapulus caudatus]|uniref:Cysteine protease n=1 Tax=Priapulus caudatus TaxID=37621 RepID=A0ABM1F8U6_PRICU|nr:PREDICTED: uncharacterized protein LOC106820809 [Priapulus caudatus]
MLSNSKFTSYLSNFGRQTSAPGSSNRENADVIRQAGDDGVDDDQHVTSVSFPEDVMYLAASGPKRNTHSLPELSAHNVRASPAPPRNESEIWDEQAEKMRSKFLSVWNNVKYGWSANVGKTTFDTDLPIWLLGKSYHDHHAKATGSRKPGGERSSPRRKVATPLQRFQQDFSSRLWFTYRRDFPVLPSSSLTSDCGWGCMMRSGQMMLAQGLLVHFLSRDWNLYAEQTASAISLRRRIIGWMADAPDAQRSPFSLHALVSIGARLGKKPGDWYGPASVAHLLKEAMEEASRSSQAFDDICIYVARDCTVYTQDVINLCSQKKKAEPKTDPICDMAPPGDMQYSDFIGQSSVNRHSATQDVDHLRMLSLAGRRHDDGRIAAEAPPLTPPASLDVSLLLDAASIATDDDAHESFEYVPSLVATSPRQRGAHESGSAGASELVVDRRRHLFSALSSEDEDDVVIADCSSSPPRSAILHQGSVPPPNHKIYYLRPIRAANCVCSRRGPPALCAWSAAACVLAAAAAGPSCPSAPVMAKHTSGWGRKEAMEAEQERE